MSGAVQVLVWTPLVTESTGISLSGKSAQPGCIIRAVTRRCRRLTALRRGDCRRARTATLKSSCGSSRWMRPMRMNCSAVRPSSLSVGPSPRLMSASGKRSKPAETGVWVVKRVPALGGLPGLEEREALGLHEVTHALQAGEDRVPLVEMAYLRLGPEGTQGPRDLLCRAPAPAPAVPRDLRHRARW